MKCQLVFSIVNHCFLGHVLLVPKPHVITLSDLPDDLIAVFFRNVKMLSSAVPKAMLAQGSFVAMNNIVSQSVPHLHVHVVPRVKGDGLKGFFWPRQSKVEDGLFKSTQNAIIQSIKAIVQ
jgi:histidine triad (HIT) family protein